MIQLESTAVTLHLWKYFTNLCSPYCETRFYPLNLWALYLSYIQQQQFPSLLDCRVKFTVYAHLKYTDLKTLGLHITATCMLEQKVIDAQTCIACTRVYCPVFLSGLNQYTSDISVMRGSGRVGDSELAPCADHRVTQCLWLHTALPGKKLWKILLSSELQHDVTAQPNSLWKRQQLQGKTPDWMLLFSSWGHCNLVEGYPQAKTTSSISIILGKMLQSSSLSTAAGLLK